MLVLVLGANFPVMFVGWEGVGLCSYLLIGFWFTKKSAADAGKKAFIVNRIGDFGFILGDAAALRDLRHARLPAGRGRGRRRRAIETAGWASITIATLLLFLGATGKSAQIPLYVWLPDAMEGPTPVSALIHAATMVTAGVYMIGRNAVLFTHAPHDAGGRRRHRRATALMAGTIGLVQNDIKRVLAYSTVSQLGYMFLAMGVGAYAAGIFHLYTHAFFKALLFLGSGAVIHALAGEQDLRNMGGLKKDLPITYWTFLIGALAIAGVPLLSGFFSKDEILFRTFTRAAAPCCCGRSASLTSLLTATYMFRLVFLTFHGERRHDAPARRRIPRKRSRPRTAHGRARRTRRTATATAHHLHDAPPVDGACADRARDRLGRRRLRRRAARARRQQPIESFLEPSFEAQRRRRRASRAADAAAAVRRGPGRVAAGAGRGRARAPADAGDRADADGVSSGVAFAGIGIAAYFWLRNRGAADAHRAAVRRRPQPAAEQVLRRRALRRRDRAADQAAVDRRAVEGRRRRR